MRRAADPRGGAWSAAMAAAAMLLAAGCETYRVEYHRRPGYFRDAAKAGSADRVTLDDGTVLVFTERAASSELQRGSGEGGAFRLREEREDGTIALRAMLPRHVLAITLQCLHNEEYELLWDEMVAQQTKREYELRGQGFEEFREFFRTHRSELAATLSRMLLGLSSFQAFMENRGGGVMRCQFHPQVAMQFKFKTVDMVAEAGGLRLLMIR